MKNSINTISLVFLLFSPWLTKAAPYLPDVPGEVMLFSGETTFKGEVRAASLKITVKDPEHDPDSDASFVVHEHTLSILGKRKIFKRYYSVKDDGIYLIAEMESYEPHLMKFATAQLWMPIPACPDFSWIINKWDGSREVRLQSRIHAFAESVTLRNNKYNCVHQVMDGVIKVWSEDTPVRRETWTNQELGILKIRFEQSLKDTIAVTELTRILPESSRNNQK